MIVSPSKGGGRKWFVTSSSLIAQIVALTSPLLSNIFQHMSIFWLKSIGTFTKRDSSTPMYRRERETHTHTLDSYLVPVVLKQKLLLQGWIFNINNCAVVSHRECELQIDKQTDRKRERELAGSCGTRAKTVAERLDMQHIFCSCLP